MCTGAEIPAAMAAAAGTAGAASAGAGAAGAAGAGAAAAGAGAAGTGLSALMSAAPELAAGQAALSTEAIPGLLSAAPNLAGFDAGLGPTFGAGGMGMADAGGSQIAGSPQAANPLSIGMSNFQNSSLGQGIGKAQDALNMYSKGQSAMGAMSPRPAGGAPPARPPGMGQPPQNVSQGSMGRPMGGLLSQGGVPDSAKLMMLKRMGLLGGR